MRQKHINKGGKMNIEKKINIPKNTIGMFYRDKNKKGKLYVKQVKIDRYFPQSLYVLLLGGFKTLKKLGLNYRAEMHYIKDEQKGKILSISFS
jgi:hypothetical protein